MDFRIGRDRFAGIIGNFLEHYDSALFGLLSPFIAPLFFEGKDPTTALVLTYSMLPLGLITRPLGALFFGWIGDSLGRREALFLSLTGMAVVTVLMGSLPLYRDVGFWAPLLLALGRMLQGFFSSGEVSGGAIFVLERTAPLERSMVSSCYDACSIGGGLLASSLIALMSRSGLIEEGWRYLFWIGALTALLGIFLRWKSWESAQKREKGREFFHLEKASIFPFLGIFFAAGFSYTTYSLAFTLMNGFIPLVTAHSKTKVMEVNTLLLLFDLFLLPVAGYLATRIGKEKVMIGGALGSFLFAIPLFSLCDQATLSEVIVIRVAIIGFGVAFSAPYYAWALEQVPYRQRYLILSLAGALGSQLIGMPASAICLWLYQTLGWILAPALYLQGASAMAGLAVFLLKKSAYAPLKIGVQ